MGENRFALGKMGQGLTLPSVRTSFSKWYSDFFLSFTVFLSLLTGSGLFAATVIYGS